MAAVHVENRDAKWKTLGVLAVCFLAICLLLAFRLHLLGHDQSMYLYSGELILQGFRPYVDFFDINPPIVFYLHAGVVGAATVLGVESLLFFKFLIAGIYFSHLMVLVSLLRSAWDLSFAKISIFIVSAVLLMTLGLFTLNWGQRDEFFVFSLLPYLFLRLARQKTSLSPPSHAVILWTAVVCGVVVALKPFFILHLLVMEAMLFVKNRSLRRSLDPEVAIVFAIQAGYAIYLAVLMFDPSSGFANQVVDVLRYYQTFDFRDGDRIDRHLMVLVPWVVTSALLLFSLGHRSFVTSLLWLQSLVALICVFLQGRWFFYHLIPLYVLTGFLAIWFVFDLSNFAKRVHLRLVTSILLITFATSTAYFAHSYFSPNADMSGETYDKFVGRLDDLMTKYSNPGDSVLPLSPAPLVTFPSLVRSDRRLGSRYLFQYPIGFFGTLRMDVDSKDLTIALDEQATIDEQKYLDNIKHDIDFYRPKLIYFMQGQKLRQNLPRGFEFQKYFEMTGLLEFIERRYEKHQEGVFTIFVRDDKI